MLAVRPPAYFPDLAFAALLVRAERVVLADTFRFSRQGQHNRARIGTSQGAQWLTAPARHGGAGPLAATALAADGWAGRHRRALDVAYASAPFYAHHADALDALLLGRPWPCLGDLACATVAWLHGALGAPSALVRASGLPGAPAALPEVWAAAGGTGAHLSLPDAAARDAALLGPRGVAVCTLRLDEGPRRQVFAPFAPGLSALDLVLNYGPDAAAWLRAASRVEASPGLGEGSAVGG